MIIYDLSCDQGHRFEGWFRSSSDFESQLERHFIRCPQCDSSHIQRVPSAVAIGGSHRESDKENNPQSSLRHAPEASTAMLANNTQIRALYRQLVQTIVAHSEDVGNAFAEEARRIHYDEAPERPIHGLATEDERAALLDEGIDVLHLPTLKDDDLN